MADQTDESPRRVRARLEKEDMLDALAAEMIERKALDLILDTAEYEDVPLGQAGRGTGRRPRVEAQAVPGEMHDPTPPPSRRARRKPPARRRRQSRRPIAAPQSDVRGPHATPARRR